jgi:hypothetical protein
MTLPTVTVIVVNFNGRQHLEACFSSLLRQEYADTSIECILVDNASQDGSVEFIETRFPSVKILKNSENVGFARAVNQGVAAATSRYVALINNDAYADPSWLQAMMVVMEAGYAQGVRCVGARMLDWYGRKIDFVSGGVTFYGMGNQEFHQLGVDALQINEKDLLFACGGAMLVERETFLTISGFDEDYFAYFEDVDFGWRLWLYGYQVKFAPDAVVYHRHHATSSSIPFYKIKALYERNALITIIKNYEEAHLNRVLLPALLLNIQRSVVEAGTNINWDEFRIGSQTSVGASTEDIATPRIMLSHIAALKELLEHFPELWAKRHVIQSQRVRSDSDIFPLFRYAMWPVAHSRSYILLQQTLTDIFGLHEVFQGSRMHRILLLSIDPLYDNLAGPGIRVVEMARRLADTCQVILAAPQQVNIEIPNVTTVAFQPGDNETIQRLALDVELIILQGFYLQKYPFLKDLQRVLVIDLYDPFHLENLLLHSRYSLDEAIQRADVDQAVLNDLLHTGDFFLCASERQRDFWLGALGSLGRLNPESYVRDPTFRSLIDVVPFGIDPIAPVHQQNVLKGVVPGIASDDIVVLWGGGIWDWLDPLTIIQAMSLVCEQRSDVKLFFMGQHHPNPEDVPPMEMYTRAIALAQELNLYNQSVFFNDRWIPYTERANYLLEADIGVSAHLNHIETRFAFRTRLLDYLWTGLPMVVSAGDTLADLVLEQELGYVVEIGDGSGFAQAILNLAAQSDLRQTYASTFAQVRQRFEWPNVLKPLIKFCQYPCYAPDDLLTDQGLHAGVTADD